MTKDRSPFTPGRPVPIEFFRGRISEIEKIMISVKQVSLGKQENIFLIGERGIGKSSLASFVRYLSEKEYGLIGSHAILGGVTTLEEMVGRIMDRFLKENYQKPFFEKIRSIFGNFIKEVGLFGVSVQFHASEKELRDIVTNFLSILRTIYEKIKDDKNGILIILDDINGLTNNSSFVNFIKSFVDEIAISQNPLPIQLLICGLPERREEMINFQPSAARIFNVIEILPLNDQETADFYRSVFEREGIEIENDALNMLCKYSGGLPMLLHELGDAVFWSDKDNFIDKDDATKGIIMAADNVGKKYLDPQLYSAIRSDKYKAILNKIGTSEIRISFQKEEIERKLEESEKKVFHNFLQKMKKLGVLSSGEKLGEYIFANELFRLYMRFEPMLRKK